MLIALYESRLRFFRKHYSRALYPLAYADRAGRNAARGAAGLA